MHPFYAAAYESTDEDGRTSDSDGYTSVCRWPRWYAEQLQSNKYEHRFEHRLIAVEIADKSNQGSAREPLLNCNFSNTEAYTTFIEAGGWGAYPGAVIARFDLRDLSEVDPVHGTFKMSANFSLDFFVAGLASSLQDEVVDVVPQAPRAELRNCVGGELVFHQNAITSRMDKSKRKDFLAQPGVCSTSGKIVNETFGERFELEQFPFDIQDCTVFVVMKVPEQTNTGEKVHDRFWLPISGLVNIRSPLDEWHLLAPSLEVYSQASSKPLLAFRLRIQRRWRWYVMNHMVIIGILSSFVFSVYAMPVEALADRAGVTFTLILTVVAFKFMLAGTLPKVPYLTVLDRYLLRCFTLSFLVALGNILSTMCSKRYPLLAPRIDQVSCCLLSLWWVTFHIYLLWHTRARLSEIRDMYGKPWEQIPLSIPPEAMVNTSDKLKWKVP